MSHKSTAHQLDLSTIYPQLQDTSNEKKALSSDSLLKHLISSVWSLQWSPCAMLCWIFWLMSLLENNFFWSIQRCLLLETSTTNKTTSSFWEHENTQWKTHFTWTSSKGIFKNYCFWNSSKQTLQVMRYEETYKKIDNLLETISKHHGQEWGDVWPKRIGFL